MSQHTPSGASPEWENAIERALEGAGLRAGGATDTVATVAEPAPPSAAEEAGDAGDGD